MAAAPYAFEIHVCYYLVEYSVNVKWIQLNDDGVCFSYIL